LRRRCAKPRVDAQFSRFDRGAGVARIDFSADAMESPKSFSNQGAWALHKTGFTLTLKGDLGKIATL
jgi:hypothetical protein